MAERRISPASPERPYSARAKTRALGAGADPAPVGAQAVDLVGDHQPPVRRERGHRALVLGVPARHGIDHVEDRVRRLPRRPRAVDAETLDRVLGRAQAGRVDELDGNAADVEGGVEGVPGRPGDRGHDRAIRSHERVEQGGLSGVGTRREERRARRRRADGRAFRCGRDARAPAPPPRSFPRSRAAAPPRRLPRSRGPLRSPPPPSRAKPGRPTAAGRGSRRHVARTPRPRRASGPQSARAPPPLRRDPPCRGETRVA